MKKISWYVGVSLLAVLSLGSVQGMAAASMGNRSPVTAGALKVRGPRLGPVALPEPATLTMIVMGLAGLGALGRRKTQ